jgi:enoyl-[acyl-carrier-protein] reductase (NADH)
LVAILEKTRQLDERIAEIAESSGQQNEGINQISKAVTSMDKVTQENAALADESASASDELKSEAERVRSAVDQLMLMAHGGAMADAGAPHSDYLEASKNGGTPPAAGFRNGFDSKRNQHAPVSPN